MTKLSENELFDLYALRTRHLSEFNDIYDKAIYGFERILSGQKLDASEKITFKEYAILRDIASLSRYVHSGHYLDEELLQQLSLEKIKKCESMINYFERNINPLFKPTLFSDSPKPLQLLKEDFFNRLNGFVALKSDLAPQKKSRL